MLKAMTGAEIMESRARLQSEIKWLGLVIRSESDQPHEWWAIGWSVRNRVLSNRYPNLYESVILSRKQFSYFNQFEGLKDRDSQAIYEAALKGYAGDKFGWNENDLINAEECAKEIIASPRWKAPFSIDVMHYWSPISMKPVGSKPPWVPSAKRLVYVSGIDPLRFTFAAGVP